MVRNVETLERLRASRLLYRLKLAVERCDDAETIEDLDRELDALRHVVDAVSDMLLGLD